MKDFDHSEALGLDAVERQALQALLAAPELTEQEWDGLRGRVVAACEPQLAGRRRATSRPRRSLLVTWLRPALPLAAAAALVLLLRASAGEQPGDTARDELTAAEQALLSDVSDAELTKLISGGADAKELLLMAVTEE